MLAPFAQRYQADLDASMHKIVASQADQPADMGVMLRYALGWVDEHGTPYTGSTGKRIRPALVLSCAETINANWRLALPAAAAVELLHNFSLIHDDIQDNSPLRHNRPTVWKIWGEANAINAGDAMFTMAYAALESLSSNISAQTVLQVWQIFNHTALELTRGQHLDMRFEHQNNVTVDEYLSMIKGKSAALLGACSQIGVLIASNDFDLSTHYRDFGLNLGMAFQIRDDILGIWGDPSVTGKSVATDILSRKKSLPVLYGLDKSKELVAIYQRETFGDEDVAEAVNALNSVNALSYTQETELGFYQQAFRDLEQADPQGKTAERLKPLVDSLFQRQY